MAKPYLLFRLVPTMRCNRRCTYCFVEEAEKASASTLFDRRAPAEWIAAMRNFSHYDVEFYCWGGEPFLLDGTYDLVRGWAAYAHVLGGNRLDTNVAFADRIADRCPTSKVKLNCSWHPQYDSLAQITRKVRRLADLDMVGMLNFVASPINLQMLERDCRMSVDDLIAHFDEFGVFVNVAADFAIVNGTDPATYVEYKRLLLRYTCPEDWRQLRCEKQDAFCDANAHFFTIQANGDLTPCLTDRVCGNFFSGTLTPPPVEPCSARCPSIVAYPFRRDNPFPFRAHLVEYVARNREYRESLRSRR
jgi:hypothetical protein